MIEVLYFVPMVLGFFGADRLLAKFLTGSWWGQPEDLSRGGDAR